MSIQDMAQKFKGTAAKLVLNDEYFTIVLILLVGIAAFGLGRHSIQTERVKNGPIQTASLSAASGAEVREESGEIATTTLYVASKSGTKYHLPWCGSAKSIKEENKIFFNSKEEAEAAGYTPAANCKGI